MRNVYVLRVMCEDANGNSYEFVREFGRKSEAKKFVSRFWLKKGHKKLSAVIEPEWRLF